MIEKVESFGAKLQLEAFRQRRVLHDRNINALVAGTVEDVSASIAKRTGRWKYECAGIEPFFGSGRGQTWVADKIRPVVRAEPERRASRAAVVDLRQAHDRARPASVA